MPLLPERGFTPDLDAIPDDIASGAASVHQLPEQPDRRRRARRVLRARGRVRREHEILVVHDNAYSETTFDGYVAPSFLATPGAKEVGVEVFSLSKGYNMTGWRCAAIVGHAARRRRYWRLKTNIDSGMFEAVQLAAVAALRPTPTATRRR
jgi:LL-diaminopimelate aminotransferase